MFIALTVLSFVLTWLIRIWTLKFKILDIPNKRSSHSTPTPRGGGVAIVICWYISITFLFAYDNIADNLYYAFLSGSILAVISLIDDLLSLKLSE
ncbi:Undecaprenyl-phosphate alpha-N-acetylglucosaminyl 1-phosphate transferase [subsurface metagenome]